MSGLYEDIYNAIADHQGPAGIHLRLMKLNEEVGEVAEAYIGTLGANKRKGQSHEPVDVASELCDVVITAMVALHDWIDSPELFLETKVAALKTRIELEGS